VEKAKRLKEFQANIPWPGGQGNKISPKIAVKLVENPLHALSLKFHSG
jgi:hypothetical protein